MYNLVIANLWHPSSRVTSWSQSVFRSSQFRGGPLEMWRGGGGAGGVGLSGKACYFFHNQQECEIFFFNLQTLARIFGLVLLGPFQPHYYNVDCFQTGPVSCRESSTSAVTHMNAAKPRRKTHFSRSTQHYTASIASYEFQNICTFLRNHLAVKELAVHVQN